MHSGLWILGTSILFDIALKENSFFSQQSEAGYSINDKRPSIRSTLHLSSMLVAVRYSLVAQYSS